MKKICLDVLTKRDCFLQTIKKTKRCLQEQYRKEMNRTCVEVRLLLLSVNNKCVFLHAYSGHFSVLVRWLGGGGGQYLETGPPGDNYQEGGPSAGL